MPLLGTDGPAPRPAPPSAWSPRWEIVLGDCPTALAWGPGGDQLLAGSLAGEVVRIEVAAGTTERVAAHAGGALCVAWSGGRMVSGGQDGAVVIDGDRLAVGGWVSAVAAASGGRRIAVAHGRDVSVLDVGSSPPSVSHHDRHDTTVTCLRWQPPTDDVLVAGSFGRIARSLVSADRDVRDVELAGAGAIASIDASATGWWAAGARGNVAHLWNERIAAGPVDVPTGPWNGRLLGFSDDGGMLATASRQMTAAFDFDAGDPLGMPAGMWLMSIGTPTALAWRPCSAQLTTAVTIGRGADDNGLLVWEPRRSAAPLAFVSTQRPVEHIAWSPHGDLLAVAFSDGTVGVGAAPIAERG